MRGAQPKGRAIREMPTADTIKALTDGELEDADVMKNAIELIYRAMFGEETSRWDFPLYLKYERLSDEMENKIAKETEMQESELTLFKHRLHRPEAIKFCLPLFEISSTGADFCRPEAKFAAKDHLQKLVGVVN